MESATKLRLEGVSRLYNTLGVDPRELQPADLQNTGAKVDFSQDGAIMKDGQPTGLRLCLETGRIEDSEGIVGKVVRGESLIQLPIRCPDTHLGTGITLRPNGEFYACESHVETPYDPDSWRIG